MNLAKCLTLGLCYFFSSETCIHVQSLSLNTSQLELDPTLIKLTDNILKQVQHVHLYSDDSGDSDDILLKYLINSNISISINNLDINILDYDYFLIITKSVIRLMNSTFLHSANRILTDKINIIIYDKGQHNSVYFLNNLSNYFHFANVLYIYQSLFYYLNSPVFPNRNFHKMQTISLDSWEKRRKNLPNMKRRLVRIVTYNNPIYFIIDRSKKRKEGIVNNVLK